MQSMMNIVSFMPVLRASPGDLRNWTHNAGDWRQEPKSIRRYMNKCCKNTKILNNIAQSTMKKNNAASTCTTNWPTSNDLSPTSTSGRRSPGCRAWDQATLSAHQSLTGPSLRECGNRTTSYLLSYRFPTRLFPYLVFVFLHIFLLVIP